MIHFDEFGFCFVNWIKDFNFMVIEVIMLC